MPTAAQLAHHSALQQAADQYMADLTATFRRHGLEALLTYPVDHLAVKAADSADFEQALALLQELAVHASYTHLGGRRLAAFQLSAPIRFGPSGATDFLELMEPRPDRATPAPAGLDHIELLVGHLDPLRAELTTRSVPYTCKEQTSHTSFILPINPHGQEVKLTDFSLRPIIAAQIASGASHVLKSPL